METAIVLSVLAAAFAVRFWAAIQIARMIDEMPQADRERLFLNNRRQCYF